jgi:hypothetical protein
MDLLHAANLRHGTAGFTSPPKEGVLGIFSPWKVRRLRPGLNQRTWVPEADTHPLDHRNRFEPSTVTDKLRNSVYFVVFIWIQPSISTLFLDNIKSIWCMLLGNLTLSHTAILLGSQVNPGIHSHEILHYYSNVNRGLLVRPPRNNGSLILQGRAGWILYKANSPWFSHFLQLHASLPFSFSYTTLHLQLCMCPAISCFLVYLKPLSSVSAIRPD